MLEQIVPSSACAVCDVCCRFPEADSALRPYFTREEIQAAIAAGVSPAAFPDHEGSKIQVVPHGEGYICPAFNPANGECTIYQSRPLDCQLYPIAVMWDQAHEQVVMGWDAKCPFIVQKLDAPESQAYVERTAGTLESEAVAQTFVRNPQLVGAFQDDVIRLRGLDRITQGLREMGSEKSTLTPFRFLSLEDRSWFENLIQAHAIGSEPLAAYSFLYHYIWRDLFSYEWAELAGHCCVFATNQDGTFLALPPLGPDPCGPAMAQAFAVLAERNRMPGVSRIEDLPESLVERCRSQGNAVIPKAGDYLYRWEDLVGLQGDRYKSQRASYNQCVKHHAPSVRPYRDDDLTDCLGLLEKWQARVKTDEVTPYARHMAEDAASAHRIALRHAEELGMVGLVAEVQGRAAGYTFGYPLTHTTPSPPENPLLPNSNGSTREGRGEGNTFCILFEITDRQIHGLSSYIFREFCKQLTGYEYINTMDDSGLEGLRRAKLAYHPIQLVKSYIVTLASETRP